MANLHHPTDEVLSPIEASAKAIKDNPIQFVSCVAVFILVLIGTLLFNLNSRLKSEVQASAYARALDIEDPQGKIDALSAITSGKTRYAAEALFMKGLTLAIIASSRDVIEGLAHSVGLHRHCKRRFGLLTSAVDRPQQPGRVRAPILKTPRLRSDLRNAESVQRAATILVPHRRPERSAATDPATDSAH